MTSKPSTTNRPKLSFQQQMILKAVAYFCNPLSETRVRSTTTGVEIQLYTACSRDISGGYSDGVPPLPIPNREVKPDRADGTAHPRESRSPPFYNKPRDSKETRGFVFSKAPFSFEKRYFPSQVPVTSAYKIGKGQHAFLSICEIPQ